MFRHHTRLGILKGGQLGRMLIQSCMDFGIQSYVMDADDHSPCRFFATEFTVGDALNFQDVCRFGKTVDLLTLEFEHVNIDALFRLQEEGLLIYPDPRIIQLVQDKGTQKEFYRQNGFPTANFVLLNDEKEIIKYRDRFPVIQKLRVSGYDGKGVYKIKSDSDIPGALRGSCILEDYVNHTKEISVIVARNTKGEIVTYPVVEMEVQPQAHLLEFLSAPAQISESVAQKAKQIAQEIAIKLNIVGLLAVEMFVTENDDVLVNEIAPRPHNSGHHTIEANVTSQFEQHLRAIMGWPLGSTEVCFPSVMVNLIGEPGHQGPARYLGMEDVLRKPGVHVHLYGKYETSPFRKMGHITVVANNIQEAKERALWVKKTVKVVA